MHPLPGTHPAAGIIAGFADHVRAYQNAADALGHAAAEHLGLNLTDHRCLDIIERHGPISAGDLARSARLSAKAITTVVDRLERTGYAERTADPRDRRRVLIAVTQEGRARAEELYAPIVRASRDMLRRYSAAELTLLVDYLDRSRDLLASHTARIQEQAEANGEHRHAVRLPDSTRPGLRSARTALLRTDQIPLVGVDHKLSTVTGAQLHHGPAYVCPGGRRANG